MREFSFVGSSRLQGATALVPPVLKGWIKEWCFGNESGRLGIGILEAMQTPIDMRSTHACWLKLENGAGALWLGFDNMAARELIFGRFADQLPDDETANVLVANGLRSLLDRMLMTLGHDNGAVFHDQQPEAPYKAGSGLIAVRIQLQTACMVMLIEARLLNQYLPVRNSERAGMALVKRQDAVLGAKLTLKLSLPLARLSVGELTALSAGDIIRGQTLLAQPFQLATEKGHPIAQACLGRTQDNKAVQLIKS